MDCETQCQLTSEGFWFDAGLTAIALALGGFHTCAQRSDASLVCWGYGLDGELGNENSWSVGDEAGEMGSALVPVNLGSGCDWLSTI
jgi:alpha-tubulin suppressor-like RCC1 family protein